jgi:cell division protease FtsH
VPQFPATRDFSEETAREIDCAVREIVKAAFERAAGILRAHRNVLEDGARRLLQKETLAESELSDYRTRMAVAGAENGSSQPQPARLGTA